MTQQEEALKIFQMYQEDVEETGELDLSYEDLTHPCNYSMLIKLQSLKLHGNQIRSITTLRVPDTLTYLSIGGNLIQSLEFLHRISPFRFLKIFNCYSNKIITVKGLRKCEWPQIDKITIHDNILVKDWQIMAQFPKNKHKKPTIIEINVEQEPNKFLKKTVDQSLRPKCHRKKLVII